MVTRGHTTILRIIALVSAMNSFAADTAPPAGIPTREIREKMATLHEQMAACLRSERPLAE